MTLRQIFDNAAQLLNIEDGTNSPVFVRERVVSDINSAIQLMRTGIDYFTREVIEIPFLAGGNAVTLDEDILNIYGPVRLGNNNPLTEVKTMGELLQFGQLYLGYTGNPPQGQPVAYFVNTEKAAGPRLLSTSIYVAPTPDQAYSVIAWGSRTPENYTVEDLESPSPEVPVPHDHAESILLPIVRWNVRTSHIFRSPDQLPAIEQEYSAALLQLGLSNPQTDRSKLPDDVLARKKAAARNAAREAYNAA